MERCKKRKDVFIISGDAGLGVFDDFQKERSDQFLNLGVAEQNTTGFGAGMALAGYKVFIYNLVPFVLFRCYEHVRNDICYQRLPVTLVGIGSGITYAPQGMTHYAVEDLGLMQTLPGFRVFSPADPVEARLAARYSLTADGPVYVRLAKRGEPVLHAANSFDITQPQVLRKGTDCAIVFHGSISTEAIKAGQLLAEDGISARVISVPQVQPFSEESFFSMAADVKMVVVVEEHFVNCGLGRTIEAAYLRREPRWVLRTLGLPFSCIHEVKDTQAMRAHYGISAEAIVAEVRKTLKGSRS
jgi:transketolase